MNLPNIIVIGGLYFPPLFFVCIVAIAFAIAITWVMNETGVSRFIWYPALFFVMLVLSIGGLISLYVMPI